MVGGVQDDLGRAIVLLQLDDLRVRVVLLEREDVAHVGATKHVDRLIVIAHDTEVATLAGEVADHQVLGSVRVLVLVDHDVLEATLVLLEHFRVAIEEPDGAHQQIVEIQGVVLIEEGVVADPNLGR